MFPNSKFSVLKGDHLLHTEFAHKNYNYNSADLAGGACSSPTAAHPTSRMGDQDGSTTINPDAAPEFRDGNPDHDPELGEWSLLALAQEL